jgi:Fic family protein
VLKIKPDLFNRIRPHSRIALLKQHRSTYYELLDGVRVHGDWEAWVEFFLEGVEQTARGAVDTAQRLAALFRADSHRMQEAGRGAVSASRLLSALRERPVCNLKQLCRQTGMTFPTASKAMGNLIDLGIARELTGQRRNRVFVYDAYLDILNEGGKPL